MGERRGGLHGKAVWVSGEVDYTLRQCGCEERWITGYDIAVECRGAVHIKA